MRRELVRDYYETVIGLNKMASLALYVDQNMTEKKDFLRIKPKNIEKICTAIMKSTKTSIPVLAMERLALLAYYIKHQERTSRDDKDLTEITSDDLDGLFTLRLHASETSDIRIIIDIRYPTVLKPLKFEFTTTVITCKIEYSDKIALIRYLSLYSISYSISDGLVILNIAMK